MSDSLDDELGPVLRREEVALLAGVSIDYVVRLEQERAIAPSAQIVTALARALRLSEPERHHLFRLAGQAPYHPPACVGHLDRVAVPELER